MVAVTVLAFAMSSVVFATHSTATATHHKKAHRHIAHQSNKNAPKKVADNAPAEQSEITI